MKSSVLRLPIACSVLFLLFSATADAQLFGRKKKAPDSPVSANLFPDSGSNGYVTSSTPSTPDSPIFKEGQPREVTETTYVIKDGRKVFSDKKKGLFRRKRDQAGSAVAETPAAPPADYPDTGTAPAVSGSPEVKPEAPEPAAREKKGPFQRLAGFRKKDEPVSPFEGSESETVANMTKPAPAPTVPSDDTPTFDPAPPEESASGGGLSSFSPFSRFRRKKDVAMDGTETEILVNRGGTLAPAGEEASGDYEVITPRDPAPSGTPAPPRNDNGTIVYQSWDDVKAQRRSAADAIVKNMKAQEAEHRRKIEQAKKDYEERVRKAKQEAEIRAIMQGGLPSGGAPQGVPGAGFPAGYPGGAR